MDSPFPEMPDPTPQTNFAFTIKFDAEQPELTPSIIDTIEASVTKQLQEAGVTDGVVNVDQSSNPLPGLRQKRDVTELYFSIPEDEMSPSQIQMTQRIIVNAANEYQVPARMENVVVEAVAPISLGIGP